MNIRNARPSDLMNVEYCNILCLPENYGLDYFVFHLMTYSQLSYVAEDEKGRLVGYVFARLVDDGDCHGYITSIAVKGTYRRLGLAQKLVDQVLYAMVECFQMEYVVLHVRKSNQAARHLFADALGFEYSGIEPNFYEDGEEAYEMVRDLSGITAEINVESQASKTEELI